LLQVKPSPAGLCENFSETCTWLRHVCLCPSAESVKMDTAL